MGQRVVGSRTRFLLTASVLVLLWLVFVWLAATGRLAELRYLNVPLVHPYPPAGYVQNPFNPSDKGDLVSVSEASLVKIDLLADGSERRSLGKRAAETLQSQRGATAVTLAWLEALLRTDERKAPA